MTDLLLTYAGHRDRYFPAANRSRPARYQGVSWGGPPARQPFEGYPNVPANGTAARGAPTGQSAVVERVGRPQKPARVGAGADQGRQAGSAGAPDRAQRPAPTAYGSVTPTAGRGRAVPREPSRPCAGTLW
ncbi:hypothetical protein GCM10010274_37820 [Streptomyces lavendofoliae]|uniref:Uncharacterized protein n=1 Tax=Streptomyces lavendofoliae TaxID=67314 RepID=A0A918HZ45_9ACTN|nr:hypothetical protein GCM10010274_37820 [Streptomyces lavendofoliae]